MTPFDNQDSNEKYTLIQSYGSLSFYPYARYALYEVLRAKNIKSIYIPDFICRDLLSPINELNIDVHFYKVTINLTPIIDDIKCDAILFVNYFGFEQDIVPYRQYKKKFGALIIEDNAHGLFSCARDGQLLGTRGDAGLLSIRKTVSLPNGAALLHGSSLKSDDVVHAKIGITHEDLKYTRKKRFRNLLPQKKLGILAVRFLRFLRHIRTGNDIPLPDFDSEYNLPSNQYLTPLLGEGVLNIDHKREIARRCKMFDEVAQLALLFDIEPLVKTYEGVSPFEFAFINNGREEDFQRALYRKGYYVLPWPDLPDQVSDSIDIELKDVKVVPFLW